MAAWVYLFSKFTPEALLFEALGIFILTSTYAGFFILRKRRMGAAGAQIPSSVVKMYLGQLITDAELLRSQLFGLIATNGVSAKSDSLLRLSAGDPELQLKITLLETKMTEQAAATSKITVEKAKLEKELADARKGAGPTAAGGAGPAVDGDLGKMKEKIASLEARLAEYSVIEDDLANLKRLQQENAQLKAQLGGAPAPIAAEPAPAPAPAATAAAAIPSPAEGAVPAAAAADDEPVLESAGPSEPIVDAAAAAVDAGAAEAAALIASLNNPSPAAAAAPAELAATAAEPAADFEKVVDQVEMSIAPEAAAAAPAATLAPETANPATTAVPKANVEKSDEDLIAEFEKMLNS